MEHSELIARINELSRKQRGEGLTAEEQEEQRSLRRQYLTAFRKNLQVQFDQIRIVDPDGSQHPLVKKKD